MTRPPRGSDRDDGRGRKHARGGAAPQHGLALAPSMRHVKVLGDDGVVHRCEYARALFDPASPYARPVAAGDRVSFAEERGRLVVVSVAPRRGALTRGRGGKEQVIAANVDQVVIVAAAASPRFRPRLIDRLIVAAERARAAPIIVVNKIDLAADRAPFEAKVALYRGLGYAALCASATGGEGVAELRDLLAGKISAAAGPSGVGKSSLLNAVEPELVVRTSPISDRWGKGVHTTTGVTLHPLRAGGFYADTPGMRAFVIAGLPAADVAIHFRDFQPFIDACRFNSCTHDHEPECAVQRAVVEGRVAFERYESYLRIIRGDEEGDPDLAADDEDEAEDGAAGAPPAAGGDDDASAPVDVD
jgi:ribosome biogenesis GTPase